MFASTHEVYLSGRPVSTAYLRNITAANALAYSAIASFTAKTLCDIVPGATAIIITTLILKTLNIIIINATLNKNNTCVVVSSLIMLNVVFDRVSFMLTPIMQKCNLRYVAHEKCHLCMPSVVYAQ